MKLIEGSTSSYKQHLAMRTDRLTKITERVAASIEAHEDLTNAERQAEAASKESGRVSQVTLRNRKQAEADQKRHLRALVTNAQLHAIAKEQADELDRLQQELEVEKKRCYPVLAPPLAAHPDLRLPPNYGAGGANRAASALGQRRGTPQKGGNQRPAVSR